MKYSYILRINCNNNKSEEITHLLNVKPTLSTCKRWEIEKVQDYNSEYIDYLNIFLIILKDKYNQLEQIGVTRDCIEIWVYYEYDQQCNMEFSPDVLKNIGDNGISLCISCWQK
jgi:hypothetical protein